VNEVIFVVINIIIKFIGLKNKKQILTNIFDKKFHQINKMSIFDKLFYQNGHKKKIIEKTCR
jgi:hypothetical protein